MAMNNGGEAMLNRSARMFSLRYGKNKPKNCFVLVTFLELKSLNGVLLFGSELKSSCNTLNLNQSQPGTSHSNILLRYFFEGVKAVACPLFDMAKMEKSS